MWSWNQIPGEGEGPTNFSWPIYDEDEKKFLGIRETNFPKNLPKPGFYRVEFWYPVDKKTKARFYGTEDFELESAKPMSDSVIGVIDRLADRLPEPGKSTPIALQRTTEEPTSDLVLWGIIKRQKDIFNKINIEIQDTLCDERDALFNDINAYIELKTLVDDKMKENLRSIWDVNTVWEKLKKIPDEALINIYGRKERFDAELRKILKSNNVDFDTFPYLDRVKDINNLSGTDADKCGKVIEERMSQPMLIELIWSYWHEESMMVQTMKVICNRFQNKRTSAGVDPLLNLNFSPLRRLGNLLWGYIQDAPNRLSVRRRAYEYVHHYGITLRGKGAQKLSPADSRTTFLEAFHRLLYLCSTYFKELDNTTVYADALPVKNALRDVHVILAEGAHNQYGDLVWVARREMYIEQFILARREMREFLPGLSMVPYREPWMQSTDAVKRLMGWIDSSVEQFSTLANAGELVLLSVRFGDWNNPDITAAQAANWAAYWREQIQDYLHSYRAVTGVDLTDARQIDGIQPSVHLSRRLDEQHSRFE